MYFVWNLHDCFFRALAARYWAFVPCRGERTEEETRELVVLILLTTRSQKPQNHDAMK